MQARRHSKEDSSGSFVRLEIKLLNSTDVILQLVRCSSAKPYPESACKCPPLPCLVALPPKVVCNGQMLIAKRCFLRHL